MFINPLINKEEPNIAPCLHSTIHTPHPFCLSPWLCKGPPLITWLICFCAAASSAVGHESVAMHIDSHNISAAWFFFNSYLLWLYWRMSLYRKGVYFSVLLVSNLRQIALVGDLGFVCFPQKALRRDGAWSWPREAIRAWGWCLRWMKFLCSVDGLWEYEAQVSHPPPAISTYFIEHCLQYVCI